MWTQLLLPLLVWTRLLLGLEEERLFRSYLKLSSIIGFEFQIKSTFFNTNLPMHEMWQAEFTSKAYLIPKSVLVKLGAAQVSLESGARYQKNRTLLSSLKHQRYGSPFTCCLSRSWSRSRILILEVRLEPGLDLNDVRFCFEIDPFE